MTPVTINRRTERLVFYAPISRETGQRGLRRSEKRWQENGKPALKRGGGGGKIEKKRETTRGGGRNERSAF